MGNQGLNWNWEDQLTKAREDLAIENEARVEKNIEQSKTNQPFFLFHCLKHSQKLANQAPGT